MSNKLNITWGAHSEGTLFPIPSTGHQKITVGKYCSIGGDVSVFTEPSHNQNFISTYMFQHKISSIHAVHPLITDEKPVIHREDLIIGNDVYLGYGTRLFCGLTIGDGAMIGAYSLVTKNIPPYSIAVGQPIRVIRKRFSDDDIEFLLKLKWWDFPDDVVADIAHILQSREINLLKNWAKANGRYND